MNGNIIWSIIKMLLKLIPEWVKIQDDANKKLIERINQLEADNVKLLKVRDLLMQEETRLNDLIIKRQHALATLGFEEDVIEKQIAEKSKQLEEKVNELKSISDEDILDIPYTVGSPDRLS